MPAAGGGETFSWPGCDRHYEKGCDKKKGVKEKAGHNDNYRI